MNSRQRRKGQRAQKRLLASYGFSVESYLEYWMADGRDVSLMLPSAADRRVVAELAKKYPNAGWIRSALKRHPEDKQA